MIVSFIILSKIIFSAPVIIVVVSFSRWSVVMIMQAWSCLKADQVGVIDYDLVPFNQL